mmetsp:Transcript_47020/g.84212  ORF Transcript_47020/g.84212 Transcript_47020/m.84212 type:complete len:93 (+) Transcript_47020:101-379(+)
MRGQHSYNCEHPESLKGGDHRCAPQYGWALGWTHLVRSCWTLNPRKPAPTCTEEIPQGDPQGPLWEGTSALHAQDLPRAHDALGKNVETYLL